MTTSWVDTGIESKLAELDELENEISGRRRRLHMRIDALYLSAPLNHEQSETLDRFEDEEILLSSERRMLHAKIDGLRAQIGLPRTRDAQWMTAAG
jgi:hypothetical protein